MKSIKFKPTAIEIPASEPFKNDLLARKDSAEILTEFIASLDEPFVLAVDSSWATGKTTFLKMWLQYAKNQKFQCLYFNAWENDFSDSPLVSLRYARNIVEAFRWAGESADNMTKYLVSKIELAQAFVKEDQN